MRANRDRNDHLVLMLAVVHEGVAIPFMWWMLQKVFFGLAAIIFEMAWSTSTSLDSSYCKPFIFVLYLDFLHISGPK